MKLAICTDTHFGAYKSSDIFLTSQMEFFKNQFLPDLRKKGIDTIVHLGDMFDCRTSVNIKILNEVYSLLAEDGKDFKWYILCGNHDAYYKTSIETNSLKHLKDIPNVTVIYDIQKLNFDGRDILMVPWQVDHKKFIKKVNNKNLDCDVCMGHLEIKGFHLNKGKVCDDGITSDLFFEHFLLTFSGHFHKRTLKKIGKNKIHYVGNTYHLTRHDIDEERGYTILDTKTLKYEFIDNTVSLKFKKIHYPEKIIKKELKGNIVDVYVHLDDKYNETKFQAYLQRVEKCETILPPTVKIINDYDTNVKMDYKVQTVTDLINEYVNNLNISYKKEIIKKILKLYSDNKTTI